MNAFQSRDNFTATAFSR